MPDSPVFDEIAAVDLGSNSFHMIVARLRDGRLEVIDRLREHVRLAQGLLPDNRLSDEARARALDCLARFGQRLRELPPGAVRAVGTNTLRKARSPGFLEAAREALGHPVEIISGVEEARLIYLGVARSLEAADRERRLVMDIGGGSTELIIGTGDRPQELESLYMGCVSMSQRFFPDGRVDKPAMRRAILAAQLEVEPIRRRFLRVGWERAVGASGTIKAVRQILLAEGWSDQGITPGGLKKLRKALIAAGDMAKVSLKSLSDERRPVLPGGVAILSAVFDLLEIERMQVSSGALREGILFDLVGRLHHADIREHSVERMIERFRCDTAQAQRVARVALRLFDQLAPDWKLNAGVWRPVLEWAARLHEIGLVVAHGQYHKHGAYLVQHSDMAGFSLTEQRVLAALVRSHRRKFPRSVFEGLPKGVREVAESLAVLLRLAALIQRGRSSRTPEILHARADGPQALALRFGKGFLEHHPLTRADLEAEQRYLEAIGWRLDFE